MRTLLQIQATAVPKLIKALARQHDPELKNIATQLRVEYKGHEGEPLEIIGEENEEDSEWSDDELGLGPNWYDPRDDW